MPRTPASAPRFRPPRSGILLAAVGLTLTLAFQAPAGAGASTLEIGEEEARESFERFVVEWLDDAQRLLLPSPAAHSTEAAEIRSAPSEHASNDDWSIEIRATRDTTVPYVGILRYMENPSACAAPSKASCRGVPTAVTEIFRYQGGHWVY